MSRGARALQLSKMSKINSTQPLSSSPFEAERLNGAWIQISLTTPLFFAVQKLKKLPPPPLPPLWGRAVCSWATAPRSMGRSPFSLLSKRGPGMRAPAKP